jgi:hypothetical protein
MSDGDVSDGHFRPRRLPKHRSDTGKAGGHHPPFWAHAMHRVEGVSQAAFADANKSTELRHGEPIAPAGTEACFRQPDDQMP